MECEKKFNSREIKDIKKHFENLWKIDVLKKLLIIDCEGTITRNYKKDLERTISFIKYGFDEGIKYMEPKWIKKNK